MKKKQIAIIANQVNINKNFISSSTRTTKRKIIFKKGLVRTEYFATKKVVAITARLFLRNYKWDDLFIELPFEGGLIQADISKQEFCAYWGLDINRINDGAYMNEMFFNNISFVKSRLDRYGETFMISRVSIYIPPKSLLESIVRVIRKKLR